MYPYRLGQSLSEYSLVLTLVGLAVIPALFTLSNSINWQLGNFSGSLHVKKPNNAAPALKSSASQSSSPHSVPSKTSMTTKIQSVPPMEERIQVSGSNGSSEVLMRGTHILQYAEKLKSTDPELSNLIIKLGQKGMTMAQSLSNGNKKATEQDWNDFTDLWTDVYESSNYKKLSTADQAYVLALTNQSANLAAQFVGFGFAFPDNGLTESSDYTLPVLNTDPANQVAQNSNQTVKCGQNGKCDPE
ncbi:MAG: hypothetical protein K0Q74_1414 [Gammaproteobacteria bacterium]|jgi:hypothetical protein|nr:hypothetical protein [Gammaproteobacteria bacterium]